MQNELDSVADQTVTPDDSLSTFVPMNKIFTLWSIELMVVNYRERPAGENDARSRWFYLGTDGWRMNALGNSSVLILSLQPILQI